MNNYVDLNLTHSMIKQTMYSISFGMFYYILFKMKKIEIYNDPRYYSQDLIIKRVNRFLKTTYILYGSYVVWFIGDCVYKIYQA